MDFKYAVFIGRFQPFHNGHEQTLKLALSKAESAIVILGSYKSPRTIKNPWTAEEREQMIRSTLSEADNQRVFFVYVRDHLYNDGDWLAEVQNGVKEIAGETKNHEIALVYHYKDDSSYYLNYFPQWKKIHILKQNDCLNATDIRDYLFKPNLSEIQSNVPSNVFNFLLDKNGFVDTEEYKALKQEYDFIEAYKKLWAQAPYQPTFVTVDAVLVRSGHVLVVKRKFNPGKGLWALPGGFLNPNEPLEESALRELKEETGIKCPKQLLKENIKEIKVFDHPQRSLRGRTITHAFFMNMGYGDLFEVKGGDDAEHARWMQLSEVMSNEDKFYEDHIHIIKHFVNKI